MATQFKANEVINGTHGKLWMGTELIAEVKSVQATITIGYEQIDVSNDLGAHQKMTGYDIAGTVVLHKVDSGIAKKYSGIQSGELPDISMTASVQDPQAKGAERVKLSEVTFDSFDLINFAMKTVGETSVPFKAHSYKYLDMI